jgi:hypothetical protein
VNGEAGVPFEGHLELRHADLDSTATERSFDVRATPLQQVLAEMTG